MTTSLITVPFHGNNLFIVNHNNEPYAPMKAIVEGMGMVWAAQTVKLNSNKARWGVSIIEIPSEGGKQATLCLPVRKLAGWMASISPNKVNPEIREKVIMYQNECDDALYSYWTQGIAINTRAVISPEQKAALFAIVAKRAGDNGKIRAQLWARHNHHFRVAKYEELLAIHFDDAVAYLENMELSTPKTQALPAPSKECEQAMSLINSLQDLTVLSGTVNYEQVRDGVRHLLIHLNQHQPYAQVKPAVTVLEAAERMMCRLWTMIDESSFRASLLQNVGKSGRQLTDGNIDTLGHINSILSRKMMHVEFPVV